MIMRVAANVSRAARTRANVVQSLFHRSDHFRMLPHAEIIVGAPDSDRFRPVVPRETARIRIGAFVPQDINENTIAAFGMSRSIALSKIWS